MSAKKLQVFAEEEDATTRKVPSTVFVPRVTNWLLISSPAKTLTNARGQVVFVPMVFVKT